MELVCELSPDVMSVDADSARIEQVMMNLVLNARDAMDPGGRVVLRTMNVDMDESSLRGKVDTVQNKWVVLQVSDNGAGMDPNVMEHIFEPFYTTKAPGKGSGLGLSVAFGVVKQHGGWIDVSSSPGRGSTFSVYLPAVSGRSEAEREEGEAELDVRGDGERVLLVEDQDEVKRVAERTLRDAGYVVLAASSGAEAMDLYRAEDGAVDVVFSDLILRDESGLDLAESLRSLNPGLPILLTSGCADKDPQWPTIEDRGYGFLEKPYEPADLVRTVHETLRLNKSRKS
jgi:two-component system cell cycle sensor histidine kinase/response regulator CckA